jgi:hypothetical protein
MSIAVADRIGKFSRGLRVLPVWRLVGLAKTGMTRFQRGGSVGIGPSHQYRSLGLAISHAPAPAFMLGAVAGFLSILIARLERVVDKRRALRSADAAAVAAWRRWISNDRGSSLSLILALRLEIPLSRRMG